MLKSPGADRLLHQLQGFAPLAIYVLAAAVLLWTAVTVYTGVLEPLANPEPIDPTQLLQRQEQVKEGAYTAATAQFPSTATEFTAPPNPFAR